MARGKHLAILIAVFLVLGLPERAAACLCERSPVCEFFWARSHAFTAEVLSIDTATYTVEGRSTPLRRVRVRVDRAWRGSVNGEIEIFTPVSSGMCEYEFAVGQKYLVFGDERDGRILTGTCSGNRRLADASEELAYLERAFEPSNGGRILGIATYQSPRWPPPAAAGFELTLHGSSRAWTTVTQTDGKFEFAGIPAGKYKIEFPPGTSVESTWPPSIQLLDNRGCAWVQARLRTPARLVIRGSVVRPNSRAARDVKVVLYGADAATKGEIISSVVTDRRGEFSIDAPAGRRYLVLATTATERAEVGPFELTPATAPILLVLRK